MKKLFLVIVLYLSILPLFSCNNEKEVEKITTSTYENIEKINIHSIESNISISQNNKLADDTYIITTNQECEISFEDNILKIKKNTNSIKITISYNSNTTLNDFSLDTYASSIYSNKIKFNSFNIKSKNISSFIISNSEFNDLIVLSGNINYTSINNNTINNFNINMDNSFTFEIQNNKFNNLRINSTNCVIHFHKNQFNNFEYKTIKGSLYMSLSYNLGYTLDLDAKKLETCPELFSIENKRYLYKNGDSYANISSNYGIVSIWFN